MQFENNLEHLYLYNNNVTYTNTEHVNFNQRLKIFQLQLVFEPIYIGNPSSWDELLLNFLYHYYLDFWIDDFPIFALFTHSVQYVRLYMSNTCN